MEAKARFHVSNFSHVLMVSMNKEFAAQLVELIEEVEAERGEISQSLFAFTERIKQQFYFMGDFTIDKRRKVSEPSSEVEPAAEPAVEPAVELNLEPKAE